MAFYTSVAVQGDNILHRFVTDTGERKSEKTHYDPTLYVASNKNTGWQTLKGKTVEPKKFASIREARDFHKMMKDVKPNVVHGVVDFTLNFIHEAYPSDIKFALDSVKIFYIDIEVNSPGEFPKPEEAKHAVDAITVYDTAKKKYYVFSTVTQHWRSKLPNTLFIPCKDERELLFSFLAFWERDYPDVISGWNSVGFDIPYIINRITNIFGESVAKRLSPWNRIDARESTNAFGQDQVTYNIVGIESLDYLLLYKKFTIKNQESYKLGYISSLELGETKVEFEGVLADLSKNDPAKYLDYNQSDVELLVKMDAKLQLMMLCCTLAYLMKCNLSDALATVRPWTSKVMFELLKENKVIDAYHRTPARDYEGGFVKESLKGKYGCVVTYDFTSLYPKIICGWNISPETKQLLNDSLGMYYRRNLVDALKNGVFDDTDILVDEDLAMAANGMFYTRATVGIIPRIVDEIFQSRKSKKREMLDLKKQKEATGDSLSRDELYALESAIRAADVMQNALKIALNSLYGAIANIHFPLFDTDNAEAITLTGQAAIQYMSDGMSAYISRLSGVVADYVIGCDTDSGFLNMDTLIKVIGIDGTPTAKNVDIVAKFADTKMKAESQRLADAFHKMTNVRIPSLDYKREKVIFGAIYVAKKRYICQVFDSEGVRYNEPDLVIVGLETNRSSTPKIIRDRLKSAFDVAINQDEEAVQQYVASFRDEFTKMDLSQIAFPRGVNNVEQYVGTDTMYKKGCPMHVRASILHNFYVKKFGLQGKYQSIRSGDKIKFVYLKTPNPIHEDIIGWVDKLPPEFELLDYVDYDTMFSKTFVAPLQNVMGSIGWNAEKTANLEDFFG